MLRIQLLGVVSGSSVRFSRSVVQENFPQLCTPCDRDVVEAEPAGHRSIDPLHSKFGRQFHPVSVQHHHVFAFQDRVFAMQGSFPSLGRLTLAVLTACIFCSLLHVACGKTVVQSSHAQHSDPGNCKGSLGVRHEQSKPHCQRAGIAFSGRLGMFCIHGMSPLRSF